MGRALLFWLERQPASVVVLLAVALIVVIAFLDYLSGYEVNLFLFYGLIVSLGAWAAGLSVGVWLTLFSGALWLLADTLARDAPLSSWIVLWNTLIRVVYFGSTAYMVVVIRNLLRREIRLARTDPLTGASNVRAFREALQVELNRARRHAHPLTLLLVDVDDFKQVNDRYGHDTGDAVLLGFAETARDCVRAEDVVARLGGDEFALLLPETDEREAQRVANKLMQSLAGRFPGNELPVTFSLGGTTGRTETELTVDGMFKRADVALYASKQAGKNTSTFSPA